MIDWLELPGPLAGCGALVSTELRPVFPSGEISLAHPTHTMYVVNSYTIICPSDRRKTLTP